MGAATCHAHSEVPATAACRTCFRPLCDICTIVDPGFVRRCADCLRRERRNGRIVRGVIALVALCGVGAGAYWARTNEKPIDDENTRERGRLARQIDEEPCDRPKILDLTEKMFQAGEFRDALRRADAFLKKCGEYPRLRWITYESHKQLSEWDLATAEATKLIESSPYDADYRVWRGLVYEEKGDWERAAGDYRQALVLKPRLIDVPINLAEMYERLSKPCDAIFPLEQVIYYHPNVSNLDELWARINELAVKGGCGGMAGEGRAQIRITPGKSVIRVTARVEDRENGVFVVDTGASYATITRAFAKRLKLNFDGAPKLLLQTANGAQTGFVVTVEKIEVQGAKATHVPAVVIDDLGDGIDGLLGLSFLSRFDLRKSAGVLEITARRR